MHPAVVDRTALLALMAGAIAIGFAPIFVRLSDVGPSATAFWRVFFALPFLWMTLLARNPEPASPLRRASWRDFPKLAAAGLLFVADLSIWHWSLQYTTVTNSTLLTNFAPLFVTLGAAMFLRETISGRFLLSLAIALAGATLLVGASFDLGRNHVLGDVLSLVAAVFYAGYLLMVKVLRRHFSGLTILAWSGLISCPGFWVAGWAAGETLWPATLKTWAVLLALGWISHLGGQSFITYSLGHLPASFSSVGLLVQPVIAAGLAWILLNEPLTWLEILGGGIVLAGIGLASRSSASA